MWMKKKKNQIKHSHVKEDMSNIIDFLKTSVTEMTLTSNQPLCLLPLPACAIVTTRFADLTKNIRLSKYCQLSPPVNDDLTP